MIGDIIAVSAGDVDASDRLRQVDMTWATALGRIMLAEGQRTPIEVCRQQSGKPWLLVSGGHRHAAATIHPELNPLRAIEIKGSALDLRLAQVAESLHRKDLDPLDRSAFVAEMFEVLRAKARMPADMSAQKIAADARWKKALRAAAGDASEIVSHAYGFTSIIAGSLHLSRRSIELDLMLARRLLPSVRALVADRPIARNATQLRALAKLEQGEQEAVARAIVEGGAKSVADAVGQLRGKAKPNDEDRRLSSFIGTFARMGLAEKKGALAQLAGMLPAGWALIEAGARPIDLSDPATQTIADGIEAAYQFMVEMGANMPAEANWQGWRVAGEKMDAARQVLRGARP